MHAAIIILNSIHDAASYLALIRRVRIRVRIRVRVRFRSCPVYPLAISNNWKLPAHKLHTAYFDNDNNNDINQ